MKINAGIDIGSVTTKCVFTQDKNVIAQTLVMTGADLESAAEEAFRQTLNNAGKNESDIATIVLTGYGRRIFKKADKVITEISAAGQAGYILGGGKPGLIIDIGGQDTKVIEINAKGEISDFLMNDKCAAGTGRFLELMAHVLGTNWDDFSRLALQSVNPVEINATCSVFAESEVVSLLSRAVKKEDIAAGLVKSIAVRVYAMIKQFPGYEHLMFCGGGAKSEALKIGLEKITNTSIQRLDNPQFAVAYGAAISTG